MEAPGFSQGRMSLSNISLKIELFTRCGSLADQEIKTGIDALVAYLKENGETNASVAAAALGVGESSVIEWANILEKANVITMTHKAGRVFLAPVTGSGQQANKEAKQAEQSTVQEMISSDLAAVEQVSLDLEEFSKSIAKVDEQFNTKYKDVKAILDRLNGIESSILRVEKRLSAKDKYVKEVSKTAQDRYEAAQKYLSNLQSFSLDTNNARAVAQELKDMLKAYEKNTSELAKALDQVMYQYRKNAMGLSRGIKEKHSQLAEVMSFDERQIREYERLRQEYKREYARMAREVDRIGKHVLDEIARGKAGMEKLMLSSSAQMNMIKPKVGEIKRDLGSIAVLNDNLVEIRNAVAELRRQREDILSEIRKMQQEVKSGPPSKTMNERMGQINSSVTSLREKIDRINKDFVNLGNVK